MNKNLLSQPLCIVTAQPCLCSRLLASNATLPLSLENLVFIIPHFLMSRAQTQDLTNKQIYLTNQVIYEQKSAFSTTVHGYSTALPLQQAACKQCRFATILSH